MRKCLTKSMARLVITLEDFSIERALSEHSVHDGISFRQLLDENGQISNIKLSDCLNPSLDVNQLDGDATYNFDDCYTQNPPKAISVSVSNIRENSEDNTIIFNATWTFEDFKAKDIEECLSDLNNWKSDIGTYGLQMKEAILKNYGLRNNRFSSPDVKVSIE